MKLADFLYENSLTPTELRRILGVKCRSTVWRYLTNERKPQPEIMRRIEEATRGRVREADFLDPTPPKCARVIEERNGKERWLLPWSSDRAKDPIPIQAGDSRLSPPVKQALQVLGGRGWYTPRGRFLLDGRQTDLKRLMRAANAELKRRGAKPIPYPGVQHVEDND